MLKRAIISNRLIISFLLLVILATEALAGSGSLGNYTSSKKPKRVEQRRTIGSGSRSICVRQLPKNSITLLVPEAKVAHKTSVTRPSFFLKSNLTQKTELKFTLVDPQAAKPIAERKLSLSPTGITKIDLPQAIKLESEKIYLWYVAIPCQNNNNDTQSQEVLNSSVTFVPLSTKMQTQLQNLDTNLEVAAFYAQNGFWYEALNSSFKHDSQFLQELLLSFNFRD